MRVHHLSRLFPEIMLRWHISRFEIEAWFLLQQLNLYFRNVLAGPEIYLSGISTCLANTPVPKYKKVLAIKIYLRACYGKILSVDENS